MKALCSKRAAHTQECDEVKKKKTKLKELSHTKVENVIEAKFSKADTIVPVGLAHSFNRSFQNAVFKQYLEGMKQIDVLWDKSFDKKILN